MPAIKNPRVENYLKLLQKVEPVKLESWVCYRNAGTAGYIQYDSGLLFGLANGTRFAPRGEFPVLYFSVDPLLCAFEVAHHNSRAESSVDPYFVGKIRTEIENLPNIRAVLEGEDEPRRLDLLERIQKEHSFVKDMHPQLLRLYLIAAAQIYEFRAAGKIRNASISVPVKLSIRVLDLFSQEVGV